MSLVVKVLKADGMVWGHGSGADAPPETATHRHAVLTAAEEALFRSKPETFEHSSIRRWAHDGAALSEVADPRPVVTFTPTQIVANQGDDPKPAVTVSLPGAFTGQRVVALNGVPTLLDFTAGAAVLPIDTSAPGIVVLRGSDDFLAAEPFRAIVRATDLKIG